MKLRFAILGVAALCAGCLLPLNPLRAQGDSALLDALVKKGVLTDQEAEDIRADEQKDYSSTAASKINLSTSIKSITFYGDLRVRYEMRDGTVHAGDVDSGGLVSGGDSQTRSRWRYRLRFGVKGDLYDQFFYGLRLATNPNYDRSGNVTFGDSDSGGPFGKDKSLLAVDQVFLGWKPTDYITLTGGKMPNPFYTTSMVWDENLNPEGAAEQFDKTFDNVEVFATMGQLVYGDSADNGFFGQGGAPTAPGTGSGPAGNFSDIFLFEEQIGFKYKFDDNTSFKAAASLMTYSGTKNGDNNGTVGGLYSTAPLALGAPNNSPSFFNGPFVGAASAPVTNVTGINNLAVLETPMEFDFKAWNIPMRFFGDFAYNLEASQRADAARQALNVPLGTSNDSVTALSAAQLASPNYQGVLTSGKSFQDQVAYQIGYEIGQLKKKGDWLGKLYWQSTGYYAVDPNLIDADIFNAATNMQGVVVAASYNWTDGVTSTLRYAHGFPVNDKLATPNVNQDLQISDMHTYDLFQADLMWKF
jgi:hypothetical protein